MRAPSARGAGTVDSRSRRTLVEQPAAPADPVLFEREAALTAVADLLGRALAGSGGALFVVGDPGRGKSAILDHVRRLAGPDLLIGVAGGDVLERHVPFSLLGQAIDGLSADPLWSRMLSRRPLADRPAAARRSYEVLRRLRTLAPRPVLIAIDDLHCGDDESLALLSFLCRRISRLPIAIIATLRRWPATAESLCWQLAHQGCAAVQRLDPLSEAAAGTLLEALAGRPLPGATIQAAWLECAGNPQLLDAVAASLANPELGGQAWPRDSTPLLQPGRLDRFIGPSPQARRLAEAMAVLGGRTPASMAGDVAGLSPAQSDAAIETLFRNGLVEGSTAGHMELVHPLISRELGAALSRPARARLQGRAFTTLMGCGDWQAASQQANVRDLRGDRDAISLLQHSARADLRRGELAAASEQIAMATELASGRASPDLLLAQAELLLARGRPGDAATILEQALNDRGTPWRTEARRARVASSLLQMSGRALCAAGHRKHGVQRLAEAAASAEGEDAALRVKALLDQALASWDLSGLPGASSLAADASAIDAGREGWDVPSFRISAVSGFLSLLSGNASAVDGVAAGARLAEDVPLADVPDLCSAWGSLAIWGRTAMLVERFDEAERALMIGLRAADGVGAAEAVAELATTAADLLCRSGRVAEAFSLSERAVEVGARLAIWPRAAAQHAHSLLQLGRAEECEDWCRRAHASATEQGDGLALIWLAHVRGDVSLQQSRFTAASDLYLEAERWSDRLGIGEPCLVPWARHAVVAHLLAARDMDAQRVLDWVERRAKNLPCRWLHLAAAASRAACAASAGDQPKAGREFAVVRSMYEEVRLPLELVAIQLHYGILLRCAKQFPAARSHLAEALYRAEELGATGMAGWARLELAGARGRRRRRDGHEALTVQETRIARLAAGGHSNQQMARELFLSINTIETHLKRVYSKLGIHSRRELMAARVGRSATDRAGGHKDHPFP